MSGRGAEKNLPSACGLGRDGEEMTQKPTRPMACSGEVMHWEENTCGFWLSEGNNIITIIYKNTSH
jgi:hypothetical protein